MKAWLAEHEEHIRVIYLPSYSPVLNPDERLNADLKYALGSRIQVRTKDKLRKVTEAHMNMLSSNPQLVRSFFNISRFVFLSRRCFRLILPIMSMVITFFFPLLQKAAG